MSSSFTFSKSLRRLKPEKRLTRLTMRPRAEQVYLREMQTLPGKLLLDTTVYVDELQGVLPLDVGTSMRNTQVWHVTVTEAELVVLAGLLDPRHPGSAQVVRQLTEIVDRRPAHRILNPDREVWNEAGVLAGLLARLQGYGKADQKRVLNDALIYLTAARHGCTVLTRNGSDFDLLQQLAGGSVVFYEC